MSINLTNRYQILSPHLLSAVCFSVMVAPLAQAAVTVDARLSQISASGFAGNGPVIVTYDKSLSETSITAASDLSDQNLLILADDVWGAGNVDTDVRQKDGFTFAGTSGFHFAGRADMSIESTPTRNAFNSQTPLTFGGTSAIVHLTFSVTEPTPWAISVDATRNPVADFAVALNGQNGAGAIYFTPLTAPVNDLASGVLAPGQYQLLVRTTAGSNISPLNVTSADEAFNAFSLSVGVVPEPASAGLLAGAGLLLARRRKL